MDNDTLLELLVTLQKIYDETGYYLSPEHGYELYFVDEKTDLSENVFGFHYDKKKYFVENQK